VNAFGRVDPTQAAAEETAGLVTARSLIVVAVLCAVGVVVPGATWVAAAGIGIVTAIPLVRVAWLAVRWARIRDARYALVAVALLVLVAVGPVVALLTR
jgi:hypothetical protein